LVRFQAIQDLIVARRSARICCTNAADAIAVDAARFERPATSCARTAAIDIRFVTIFDFVAARGRNAQSIHPAFTARTMDIRGAFDTVPFSIASMSAIFGARRANGFVVESTQTIGKTPRFGAFIG
jgi:hypothetical protein